MIQRIGIRLDDDAFQEVLLMADNALTSVTEQLVSEKGESGTVTIKICLGKKLFLDGYKRTRDGLDISYKVDTQIVNKTSSGASLSTDRMMLRESDSFGYELVTAPDPQQDIGEYLED